MSYTFTFDATFCSGCKACQAACKDRNDLPLGVLWRRVVEVSGGSWQREGEAWTNTVFAYNVSLSCNHCVHPKCAGVCPANAYTVRADGIVLLDTTKCMGCGYCAWACPYGAPQYNRDTGTMTKCNFCYEDLQQGLPPACVAACPMRVLDCRETTGLAENELKLWDAPSEVHPYPLSPHSHTQPRLAIQPHAAMKTSGAKFVANLEEIRPRLPSKWEEMPLVLFTLFMQMAVGGFWALMQLFPWLWIVPEYRMIPRHFLLLIGACLGMGMLVSLMHLGAKKRAWRALSNLRKSCLSREVLFTGLFGMGWLFTASASTFGWVSTVVWTALTAVFGLGLIHSMASVYRLPAISAWNTWRTNAVFFISTLLLGQSLLAVMLPGHPNEVGNVILILLFLQLFLMYKWLLPHPLRLVRVGLILAAMILSILSLSLPGAWVSLLLFLIVAIEEGMGRWLFYQAAHETYSY